MATSAPPGEARDLLVKLCGMLGSDFDGERAAAALKVTALLRQMGRSWDEVLHLPGGTRGRSAGPPTPDASASPERPTRQDFAGGLADWRADLACCKRYPALMTAAERAYVGELTGSLAATVRSADHVRVAGMARRIRRQLSTEAFQARAEARV